MATQHHTKDVKLPQGWFLICGFSEYMCLGSFGTHDDDPLMAWIYSPHWPFIRECTGHHCDVIMGAMTSQITSRTIVYSTAYSGADKRKHQSSASLAFVKGIHRWPVNSLHKWPVTRKMFPSDDVSMLIALIYSRHWLLYGNLLVTISRIPALLLITIVSTDKLFNKQSKRNALRCMDTLMNTDQTRSRTWTPNICIMFNSARWGNAYMYIRQ